MALQLSARAKLLNEKTQITPNLIIEVEGWANLYASLETLELARLGENGIYIGQPGLVLGGSVVADDIKPYVSLSGSGNTITQQLEQDKGSSQSVSSFNLELIDKNAEISKLVSPGVEVDETLSRRAKIYINYGQGLHPEDSVIILKGIVSNIKVGPASVKMMISHPEQQKRQDLFIKQTSKLTAVVSPSDTTVTVATTNGFISSNTAYLKSYIKINDEIIQAPSKTSTQFTSLTRGQFGTTAANHQIGDDVSTFYKLEGNAIDIALAMMLSKPNETIEKKPKHIGALVPIATNLKAIFFNDYNIQKTIGLVPGDLLDISGSLVPSNNQTGLVITSFGVTSNGSYVLLNTTLTQELDSPATITFRSKYDILEEGLGMLPEDVDVAKHEDLLTKFSSTIPDYEFRIDDTIKAKEFLEKEIYFPAGLYSLPREAKASVGITLPPIADQEIKTLDESVVINASELSPERSVNSGFYNSVIYKYNKATLEDKFLTGQIVYSADSQERFKTIRNRPLTIESKGLRPSAQNDTIIKLNTFRLLERYRFAATRINNIRTFFKTGYTIDVGDTVIFGSAGLKTIDLSTGVRNAEPELYEVVNKSLNIKTGEVSLDLLSTAFEIDGRYGVISPSSYTDSGSTTSYLIIKDSFSTTFPQIEKDKWKQSIGSKIAVHSQDWSFYEETTLTGFDDGNDYKMLISPSLSSAPAADYIVDIAKYPTSIDQKEESTHKLLYAHFNPQILVVSGSSSTIFDIGAGDIGKVFVGSIIKIHNSDFSIESPEVLINDITGNTITVDDSLGFTPSAGQLIELVGFPDEGLPYRIL